MLNAFEADHNAIAVLARPPPETLRNGTCRAPGTNQRRMDSSASTQAP